jgi:HD-GYP domain-containing protein (c-di-GMP phosphodiesterase class II)
LPAYATLRDRSRPAAVEDRAVNLHSDRDPGGVAVLISLLTSLASVGLALTAVDIWHEASTRPWALATFVGVTFVFQLLAAEVYGRGAISVAGVGLLATGFTFGPGPAIATAVLTAAVHAAQRRAKPFRALFNVATFALAAGAGAGVYHALAGPDDGIAARLGIAFVAGAAFWAVNIGLLSLVMSLAERASILAVWRERFEWLTAHYLAFGPLAVASTIAYERIGIAGLLAFALPPALMTFSVRQYLARTRSSVEEVRQANEELRRTNAELEAWNDDLKRLFEFAGGLAARAHAQEELIEYAERALNDLAGARTRVSTEWQRNGIALVAGGDPVGSLQLEPAEGFNESRWERLREALLPQLATAIESTSLIEEVRKRHVATIAALSRSMGAKDLYTGGHTERAAAVAVALAQRLGYSGEDLDAIEVGALMHDIGKIGVPEHILHKPGPLNEEEWEVMKRHPLTSEYILFGIDLSPIVLQIARSSHERYDGGGYPDGLAGEEIPLPARIVFVADALDAITSDRPYRPARRLGAALEELRANAGTQFCPKVIAALEQLHREQPQLLGSEPLSVVEVGAA